MLPTTTSLDLSRRRIRLGIGYASLAARSGVSVPTLKRMLGGELDHSSFGSVVAVARALGVSMGSEESDEEELLRTRAREMAERTARLVQGTSGLEAQAVDQASYRRLVERTYHELLSGPRKRLWND